MMVIKSPACESRSKLWALTGTVTDSLTIRKDLLNIGRVEFIFGMRVKPGRNKLRYKDFISSGDLHF